MMACEKRKVGELARRSLLWVAMLLMALLLVQLKPVSAQAASLPVLPKELKSYYAATGCKGQCYDNFPKGTVFSAIKSSNKNVVSIFDSSGDANGSITIEYLKPGKATVSFKATLGKKSKTYKINVYLYKWENPCKTIKIGNKNYLNVFKSSNISESGIKNGTRASGKLDVKLKSRYKIKKIRIATKKLRDGFYTESITYKTIKNGTKIKLTANSKTAQELYITFYDTKAKLTESFLIR